MGERGPQPGEGGRPPIPIDLDVVRRAASIGCTSEEIAAMLGIGRRTLFDRMEQDPDIKDAVDEGRAQGRVTLRRLQWKEAQAGNPTMLIWLGKQLLGQRDKHDVTADGSLVLLHLTAARAVSSELEAALQQRQLINARAEPSDQHQPPPANLLDAPVPLE